MGEGRLRWRLGRRGSILVVGVLAVGLVGGGVWWSQADAGDPGQPISAGSGTTTGATPGPTTEPTPTPTESTPGSPATDATPSPDASTVATPDLTPVPEREVVELPPVALAAPADFGNSVSARVSRSVRVDGVGKGIGEISGPAVLLTIAFTNGSADPVDLDYVVVNLFGADGAPGQTLWGDSRTKPFSGVLAPGAEASGDFVLRLPASSGAAVTVTVSYGAMTPTAVFTGEVAT